MCCGFGGGGVGRRFFFTPDPPPLKPPSLLLSAQRAGRAENIVGWYHSHPGYGCWLSGIDVGTQVSVRVCETERGEDERKKKQRDHPPTPHSHTQTIQQQFSDPFLAVVVDPHRTLAAGRVEVGAFRTYPEGARRAPRAAQPTPASSGRQTIPLAKVEDYGVHADAYYPLEVSVFASSQHARALRGLWARYWAATLAASPLAATAVLAEVQAADIADKLAACEGGLAASRAVASASVRGGGGDDRLADAAADAARLATEQAKGLASQAVKRLLFGRVGGGCGCGSGGGAAVAMKE